MSTVLVGRAQKRRAPSPAMPVMQSEGEGQAVKNSPHLTRGKQAANGLAPRSPREAALRRAVRERLSSTLDAQVVAICKQEIEDRLGRLQPSARAAMIPAPSVRAELTEQVVAALPRHVIVSMLSPEVASERRALLELSAGQDPMTREAALDALCTPQRPAALDDALRSACRLTLESGFALHGAGRSADQAETRPIASPSPTPEAAMISALRQGEHDLAIRLLSAHSAMELALVRCAIERLDPRSVLALSWRAGYSARTAVLLQVLLLGLPPSSAVRPDHDGGASMGRGEMAWQLSLLAAG